MTASRTLAATLILALAAVFVAPAAIAQDKPLAKFRVLFPIPAVDEVFSPLIVAKDMGYYKEEGLDVTFIPTQGAQMALLQVAAGNAEVGLITPSAVVVGIQPAIGMRVMMYHNLYYGGIWSISVPQESPIQSVAELKGKKIGVINMGSAGVLYGKAFLASAGLEAGKDGTGFIAIGVGAQGAAALRTKAVEAVLYFDGMVVKLGHAGVPLRKLAVDERSARLPDVALTTSIDQLEKTPQLLIGFARATVKGYEFTETNREAAIRMVWRTFPASKVGNVSDEQALAIATQTNKARMDLWHSPAVQGRQGFFLEDDYKHLVQFTKDFAMIAPDAEVKTESLYTNKHIAEINSFDRDAIRAQARRYDAKSVR